ncbi:aldehyde dehydrogenase family protein [Aciditerrimonas ferrireducens]|jgi:aldehyde dehydrogenase (NAD+)|uniref:aldehyde dehydrogenase (NAD(+)) n=1 Tax=Aciditerrimonas ferrireducens TaxID=667306 RepID=A0ABV6BYP3_9ACTN|nr:aldehyde dehydrogenase family protein [Aciditerrimonas ferrireducens]MCK4177583.1 aldehyde dehydrogenase family protein [Aciditerrimonas ferrireducens]
MQEQDRIYVGGQWVPSQGTGRIPVVEAATEEVIGTVPEGTPGDVEAAVAAAAEAFPGWASTPPEERAAACTRIAKGLEARKDELATLISREVGMVRFLSELVQVGLPIHSFGAVAGVVERFAWEEQVGNSLVVREPIGVVGCITPWNYPLHQIAAKVAFALGAGCTVVLKPSEVAPLNAYVLAEVVDDAGLPAGVFNMVSGTGPVVGEALASHPLVDMVSFTGSTRAGKRVGELCMQRVARVALELGGKSANVLLPDADFARAVPDGVGKAFLNSGQTCSALTRMLVPRDRLAEVEELAARAAEALTVGDPLAEGSRLGPLASAAQWERVQGYIRSGIEEGAKLVTGGPGRPEGLDRGFYARPTVFSEVAPGMRIAQEEIFGPVLAILPYDDEDQALEIANGTIYGLAGGVWAGSEERALAFARRLRTGQVEVNGGAFNPDAPFGGYKQSGIGREYGRFGLEEFLEVKSIQR